MAGAVRDLQGRRWQQFGCRLDASEGDSGVAIAVHQQRGRADARELIRVDRSQSIPEHLIALPLAERLQARAAGGSSLETFGQWQRDQVLWNRLRTVYTDQLASIRTPTLLVHGDRDTGVPLARIETAAELLPSATLEVAHGAGHWVQRDRPDIVIPAMLEQLRSADAPTTRS